MRNTTEWQVVAAMAVAERETGCPSHLEGQKTISSGGDPSREPKHKQNGLVQMVRWERRKEISMGRRIPEIRQTMRCIFMSLRKVQHGWTAIQALQPAVSLLIHKILLSLSFLSFQHFPFTLLTQKLAPRGGFKEHQFLSVSSPSFCEPRDNPTPNPKFFPSWGAH